MSELLRTGRMNEMGRFEDRRTADHARRRARHLLPRKRCQRTGPGQRRQRRRPADRVQQLRHSLRRYRRLLSGRRIRPALEHRRRPAHRADSESARCEDRAGRQCRHRRRLHRAAFEIEARGTGGTGQDESSIAGWKRIRNSSISSSTAASSNRSNRCTRSPDDRTRRHTPRRQRPARRVQAAARLSARSGRRRPRTANWPNGPAPGTPRTAGLGFTRAKLACLKSNGDSLCLDGVPVHQQAAANNARRCRGRSDRARRRQRRPGARSKQRQQLWRDEKPDEYFFLEVYGSAVVEHLTTMPGARLCAWAESHDLAVLPHYSPGYPEWDIAEQPRLLELIRQTREHSLPYQLEVLDSGMLRPKKSLLAVFGLTHHTENVRRLTDLIPCESCSFLPCQYRRAPYRRALPYSDELSAQLKQAANLGTSLVSVLDRNAKYVVNAKALARWSNERLAVDARGQWHHRRALPLRRHHLQQHGPPPARSTIASSWARETKAIRFATKSCAPAPGDDGHQSMCRFLNDPPEPQSGPRPRKAASWAATERRSNLGRSSRGAAGCYCESIDRLHKWGLVLETIHFALVQRENGEFAATG